MASRSLRQERRHNRGSSHSERLFFNAVLSPFSARDAKQCCFVLQSHYEVHPHQQPSHKAEVEEVPPPLHAAASKSASLRGSALNLITVTGSPRQITPRLPTVICMQIRVLWSGGGVLNLFHSAGFLCVRLVPCVTSVKTVCPIALACYMILAAHQKPWDRRPRPRFGGPVTSDGASAGQVGP
jgi:hypothetical protein